MEIEKHRHRKAFSKQAWRSRRSSVAGGAVRVSGAAVPLLHVLRVLGLAPVSITPTRAGHVVNHSRPLTIYVYIKHIIICTMIILGFQHDLQLKNTSKNFNRFVPSIVLWILYVLISVSATGIGALRSPKRIVRLMNYLHEAQKITRADSAYYIRKKCRPAVSPNDKSTHFQLALFGILEICAFASNIFRSFSSDAYSAFFFILNCYASMVNTNFLTIQIMFVVQRVQEKLHSVNERLRVLLDELQCQKNAGCSFRASERMEEISEQLSAAGELAARLNSSEGAALLYNFIVFVFKMNLSAYNLYMNLQDAFKSTFTMLEFIIVLGKIFWFVRTIIYLMFLIEPCHGIHQELLRSPVLVSRLLARARSAADPRARALRRLALPMQERPRVFAPLGAIVFSRSLYTTVLGTITTCFTLFVKVT